MQQYKNTPLIEHIGMRLRRLWNQYKFPFLGSMSAGFAAYMFMITNKLINHDDLSALFGKGATLSSGRWGISLVHKIFPSFSVPWLWGLFAIVTLSITICFIINLFSIRSKPLQFLLGGIFISFPTEIGTMMYMFTVPCYAIGMLSSVLAVVLFRRNGIIYKIIALGFAILMMSIYQAYFSVTGMLFVLALMNSILRKEAKPLEILREGVKDVLFLAVTAGCYYVITLVLMKQKGITFSEYATTRTLSVAEILRNLPQSVLGAYHHFLMALTGQEFGLIQSKVSFLFHGLCGLFCIVLLVMALKDCQCTGNRILLLVLAVLLPLSINCLYVLLSEEALKTTTSYGFVGIYFFAAILVNTLSLKRIYNFSLDLISFSLILIIATNVFAANKHYLRMHLEYENTYALYNAVMTQVEMTPGFDENSKLALIGDVEESGYLRVFKPQYNITGITSYKNAYSRNKFITYYLGMNMNFAEEEEIKLLELDPRVIAMNAYPYYGYVQKIDDYIVVKLG